jgi:hypothetical protein
MQVHANLRVSRPEIDTSRLDRKTMHRAFSSGVQPEVYAAALSPPLPPLKLKISAAVWVVAILGVAFWLVRLYLSFRLR